MSETRPVFNDVSGGIGLLQECERICNLGAAGITGNSNLLKGFTTRVNSAIDRFHVLAGKYDKNWTVDDRRHGDTDVTKGLPILSTNLKSGIADYLFDTDILSVIQVFAADSAGNFIEITRQDDVEDPETYIRPSQSGRPTKYTLVGHSIILNYLPNYNYTYGLKVKVRRVAKKFTTADGSISLGIPSPFFDYIARKSSWPYLAEKGLKHAAQIRKEIGSDDPRDPYYGGDELQIANFYSQRSRNIRNRLVPRQQNNR